MSPKVWTKDHLKHENHLAVRDRLLETPIPGPLPTESECLGKDHIQCVKRFLLEKNLHC